MKKLIIVAGLAFVLGWAIKAGQNPDLSPYQMSVPSNISHTLCTVTAATTKYCFAGDGLWLSLNGAAYVQVGAATAGVSSISVNGGSAQTGAVLLIIPTKATTTATTVLQ